MRCDEYVRKSNLEDESVAEVFQIGKNVKEW